MTETIRMSPVQTLRIVSAAPDALELEATWATGGRPPPSHWHPSQHERFEVLEGELTVQVDGAAPRVLAQGETLEILPRVAHCMWNAGASPARASWRITPPLQTEAMFREIDEGAAGLRLGALLWRFRREFRLGRRSPRSR